MKYKERNQHSQGLNENLAGIAPLGNATKLRTPPSKPLEFVDYETGEIVRHGKLSDYEAINEARNLRFKLQDSARDILFSYHQDGVPVNTKGYEVHHRTCSCTRFRTSPTVQIVKSSTNNKSFYGGTMSCANSRTCPVCSAKISERKSNEMRTAFNMAKGEGLHVSLLTLTAPHHSGDLISELVSNISGALQNFWRGATANRFKKRYGVVGNIRSFEVRYGSNGWHPHFHIVIFSKHALPITRRVNGKLSSSQSDEWISILERWQSCCARAGLSKPNHYGMDIQNGDQAGEYITKFGSDDEILKTKSGKKVTWDMADEMTKGNSKTGKASFTPWDFLSLSSESECENERKKFRLLFLDYARAMAGVSLIKWSRGLRKYFDLGSESSDEEILKQELDKADLLCHITASEWEFINKNKLRSLVLQLSETEPRFNEDNVLIDGGSMAVARLLYSKQSDVSFDEFYSDFINRGKDADHDDIGKEDYITSEIRADHNPFSVQINANLLQVTNLDWFERREQRIAYQNHLKQQSLLYPELYYFAQSLRR